MICKILLPLDDVEVVDFSSGSFIWKYTNFECNQCGKDYTTKRGLYQHKHTSHNTKYKRDDETDRKTSNNDEKTKSVKISDKISIIPEVADETKEDTPENQCNPSLKHNDNEQIVRFKEVTDEREKNTQWVESHHREDEAYFTELKETEENYELCQEAKRKEIENFEDYQVFEEVSDQGQHVIGTRFVLTNKPDGSIKARLVIKGFQEDFHQSDSPTASQDTLKVFCAITANKKWKIMGSDVCTCCFFAVRCFRPRGLCSATTREEKNRNHMETFEAGLWA